MVLSLISDWAWEAFLSDLVLSKTTEYNPKINVILGFLAILIVEKLDKRASG